MDFIRSILEKSAFDATYEQLDDLESELKAQVLAYAHQREVSAKLDQMDSHIGRLGVLRAWAVNHRPVFESAERLADFTIREIDDEIKIVEKWKVDLTTQHNKTGDGDD